MSRTPSPPVVASGLSGFVLGVIFALLATGAISSGRQSNRPVDTLPPTTPVADSLMFSRIRRLVNTQLGPGYPDSKQPRLIKLTLFPAGPVLPVPDLNDRLSRYRSVFIDFQLNDHPLGRNWRLREAKSDIFRVMQSLYTSQLGIYNVFMDGRFPIPGATGTRSTIVLRAYMDHITASTIPWRRWGREDEARLWLLMPYKWHDSRFA